MTSHVVRLTDTGTALVISCDAISCNADDQPTYFLYNNGEVTLLDFGAIPVRFRDFLDINNNGIISGTTDFPGTFGRGFRFDPRTGVMTLLEPLPTEANSWALDINNRGNVLGYSFLGDLERIGVWDPRAEFHTYFVEGTPEFPTVSNRLRFNDNNLIVITEVSSPEFYKKSYLVPKPGVRLNLADLVENLPPGLNLGFIQGINNHGDMIGSVFFGSSPFLLQRVGPGTP